MVKINKKNRIYYLDFMRGIAIFFMIMQHTMLVHEFTGGEGDGIIGGIFVLLGTAPAAPVFMLIMGLFLVKGNRSMRDTIIRGLKLFALGYGLNFIRFTVPALIAGESNAWELFFGVDILQLAGLSIIVAAFVRKIARNKYAIPALIVIILLVSPMLWGGLGNHLLVQPLWGTNDHVAFPFFPWIIYPMLGMYLSPYLLEAVLPRKTKRNLLFWGIGVGTIGLITLNMFPSGDYSRYGLGASLLVISFVFLWLLVCEFLINKFEFIRNNVITRTLYYWSEQVTNVYIIQWVIFGWSMLILGANELSDVSAMFFGFGVVIATHLLMKYTSVNKLIPKI